MSRKSHRRRHKKNKFMSSVLYYVLVLALVAGLLFVVKVNRQERAERTEYKDIGVLDDMMVRPTAEPTETPADTAADK